jgi:hypothetical protein
MVRIGIIEVRKNRKVGVIFQDEFHSCKKVPEPFSVPQRLHPQ